MEVHSRGTCTSSSERVAYRVKGLYSSRVDMKLAFEQIYAFPSTGT
jgi:hypothetical protein